MTLKPLIEAKNLSKNYPSSKGVLQAVHNVSFSLYPGETIAIVGESGCGKSTLARLLLRLEDPSSGELFFEGENLLALSSSELKTYRQKMQVVFQDPFSSLNPRMTIGEIIEEPLHIHNLGEKKERPSVVEELMRLVGLPLYLRNRFPHTCSGGQRQRVGIARALAVRPRFLVCDEPISSLDMSVRAQILNLLKKIQLEMGLTILFIAHDLSVVKYISHKVAVMYLGHLVEIGPTASVFASPLHPYTQALLSAIPIPDPQIEKKRKRLILQGDPPSPINPPAGCPFAGRCPRVLPHCHQNKPLLQIVNPQQVSCHLFDL